jgi:hypothetical protein
MVIQDAAARRPLIMAGMHRSGTSFTASLLASAGVHLGDRLLPAQHGNDEGHFEDTGILAFHERVLRSLGLDSDGFVTRQVGRTDEATRREAHELVASRAQPGRLWGWKEPRTVLFLDCWRDVLPDARYLFVFRNPWEVADSLYRRGDKAVAADPALALRLWLHYNRAIIDFATDHPDRCLVVGVRQVIGDPASVLGAVRTRLGLPVGRGQARFHENLFVRDDACRHAAVVRQILPEAVDVLDALLQLSGSTADAPAAEPLRASPAAIHNAIADWARASRAEAEIRYLTGENLRLATEMTSLRKRRSNWKKLPRKAVVSLIRKARQRFRDAHRPTTPEPAWILPLVRPSPQPIGHAVKKSA